MCAKKTHERPTGWRLGAYVVAYKVLAQRATGALLCLRALPPSCKSGDLVLVAGGDACQRRLGTRSELTFWGFARLPRVCRYFFALFLCVSLPAAPDAAESAKRASWDDVLWKKCHELHQSAIAYVESSWGQKERRALRFHARVDVAGEFGPPLPRRHRSHRASWSCVGPIVCAPRPEHR